jgi:hypothetical protein
VFANKIRRKIDNWVLDNTYYQRRQEAEGIEERSMNELLPKTKKPTGNRLCCIHPVDY